MSLTSLPYEIQHEIVAYFRGDQSTLKQLSYIGRVLHDIAKKYLFEGVTFKSNYRQACRQLKYLQKRPHLARHLKAITLRSRELSREWSIPNNEWIENMNKQSNILTENLLEFTAGHKDVIRSVHFTVPSRQAVYDETMVARATRRVDDLALLLGSLRLPRLHSLSLSIRSSRDMSNMCEGEFSSEIPNSLKNRFDKQLMSDNLGGVKHLSAAFLETGTQRMFPHLKSLVDLLLEKTPMLSGLEISFPNLDFYYGYRGTETPVLLAPLECLKLKSLSLTGSHVSGLACLLQRCNSITSLSLSNIGNRQADGKTENWGAVFKGCENLRLAYIHLDRVGCSVNSCGLKDKAVASMDDSDRDNARRLFHHVLSRGGRCVQGERREEVIIAGEIGYCAHNDGMNAWGHPQERCSGNKK